MSNGTAVPATANPAPAPITLRRVRIVGNLIMSISKKREKALRCQHGGSSVVKNTMSFTIVLFTLFREPSSLALSAQGEYRKKSKYLGKYFV
jgi:hypothetical protein